MEKSIEILASEPIDGMARNVYDILCKKGCKNTNFSFGKVSYTQFANGEYKPRLPESVRERDVYLFHSMYHPDPNSSLVQLLFTINAASRASAKSVTLVLPYMTYTRQDRRDEYRVPISFQVVADCLQMDRTMKRIITLDLHCQQTEGFFRPGQHMEPLHCSKVHASYFRNMYEGHLDDLIVVSPDHGGTTRARSFAKKLSPEQDPMVPVYFIDKRRSKANEVELLHFVGAENLDGKHVVIYDDMIDTGGSILQAAKKASELGARKVYACSTFGIFSSSKGVGAEEKFQRAHDEIGLQVVITNAIPRPELYYEKNANWLKVIPVENLLADAIDNASRSDGSLSKLND